MEIRKLTEHELEQYWTLRLEALKTNPEAFGASYEEEIMRPLDERIAETKGRLSDRNVIFIAVDDDKFIGMTGIVQNDRRKKVKHTGFIWGVYVSPSHRGKKLGKELLISAINYAKSWDDLEILKLTVVSSNIAAVKAYEKLGFEKYGTEPRALKIDDTYYDEDLMILFLDQNTN